MGLRLQDSDAAHASRGTITIKLVEGDWLLVFGSCAAAEARAA